MSSTREDTHSWRSLWDGWASRLPFAHATNNDSSTSALESQPRHALETTRAHVLTDADETLWIQSTNELFCGAGADKGVSPLRHIQQRETWDCGIACLLMVADWLGLDSVRRDDTLQTAGTESIWTVDLMHILQDWKQRYSTVVSFSYLFCSQTLTLNERLSDATYYVEAFGPDRIRVTQRLQSIHQQSLPALQLSHLSLDRVVDCVQRENCVSIALVDNSSLHNPNTATSSQSTRRTGKSSRSSLSSYVGHFIILTGISHDPQHLAEARLYDTECGGTRPGMADSGSKDYCLVVQNPACDAALSYWTVARFEEAWRADGTDQDILFVVRHRNPRAEER